jgi:maltose/moltooligosaccharide transporter
MAIYRSPVVSLMPDITLKKHHSKANGVINMVGGFFVAITLFGGGTLVAMGRITESFLLVSIIMIITFFNFLFLVREPRELEKMAKTQNLASSQNLVEESNTVNKDTQPISIEYSIIKLEKKVELKKEFYSLFQEKDKSRLFILLAIGSWFIAWNALEVWLPPYISYHVLGNTDTTSLAYLEGIGEANRALAFIPIVFILSDLPGGYLGSIYGQKNTIIVGLILFILAMILASFQTTLFMISIYIMLADVAWGLINVNSIVIVCGLSKNKIGGATGLYYFASSLTTIIEPILFGAFKDVLDTLDFIFTFSVVFLILACMSILKVSYIAPK